MAEIQKQNELYLAQNTYPKDILKLIFKKIKETTNQAEKEKLLDFAVNKIIVLADLGEKYDKSKQNIKADTRKLIKLSLSNRLNTQLGEYNINKFDIDHKSGLDDAELDIYSANLKEAVLDMIKLGGLNNLSQIHHKVSQKDGFCNLDKKIADKVNFQESIFGVKGAKNFCEEAMQRASNLSETQLTRMKETKFDITSQVSNRELSVLLVKEFGDGIEDVFRFIGNILSGIILIPRYTALRIEANSDDKIEATKAKIEIRELVEQNPALGLLELLGEKGVEMIKQLGGMLTSGKQGDIALTMVIIAGLVAGGAGAAKLGLNLARKSAVKSARKTPKETRINNTINTSNNRKNLKNSAAGVNKVYQPAAKIDDIVGGAGIGHMTGQFSGIDINKAGKRISTGVASAAVLEANGKLNNPDRISLASDLLGRKLSKKEQDGLLVAHNYPQGDNIAKGKALMNAGFSREEAKILMDQGVAGEYIKFNYNDKLINFFDRIDLKNKVKDQVNFLLEKNELSYGDFIKNISRINGIINGIKPKDRDLSDNVRVKSQFRAEYLPPKDKENFLKQVYEKLSKITNNKDRGILLFYAIQFIHPFGDGNGRTGRFLYELLKNNYDITEKETYKKLLTNTEGREYLDLPDAELIGMCSSIEFCRKKGIKSELGFYTIGQLGDYNITSTNIKNKENLEIVQNILDNNSTRIGFSFRDYILYKINEKRQYSDIREVNYKIGLDGKKILDELLNDDDINYIISEYSEYEKEVLGNIFDINKTKKYIEIIKENNVKSIGKLGYFIK